MSDELTKSQDLSAQITDEDVELSDQDLEDVAGGTAISTVDSTANAGFGGVVSAMYTPLPQTTISVLILIEVLITTSLVKTYAQQEQSEFLVD